MKTESMIEQLRVLHEQHRNDHVDTFDTNWSLVCWDVANRLEELYKKNKELDEKINKINSIVIVSSDSSLESMAQNIIGAKVNYLEEIGKIISE